MKILWRKISDNHPPLVIGEVSANHKNSLKEIYRIIDCAAEIKLEAIKFQTFNVDDMTLNISKKNFMIKEQFEIKKWNNRSLYSLYKEAQLPFEWHKNIFKRAEKKGLICFSSVFDLKSLFLLESINCPAFKIASLESQHFPLINQVITKKKPLIISTGTLSMHEINSLVSFLKKKKTNFALLHCLTQYPAELKNCNLNTIPFLKKKYRCIVGFSDHTTDSFASLAAVSLGSNIIEKHFMLNDKVKTLDSQFSFNIPKMEKLIKDTYKVWTSLGKIKNETPEVETFYKKFRRSIYISENIRKNEVISINNVKIIRPGFGLSPIYYDKIIGKKAKKNLYRGDPLKIKNLI
jgi:pseudaminic acid synthase